MRPSLGWKLSFSQLAAITIGTPPTSVWHWCFMVKCHGHPFCIHSRKDSRNCQLMDSHDCPFNATPLHVFFHMSAFCDAYCVPHAAEQKKCCWYGGQKIFGRSLKLKRILGFGVFGNAIVHGNPGGFLWNDPPPFLIYHDHPLESKSFVESETFPTKIRSFTLIGRNFRCASQTTGKTNIFPQVSLRFVCSMPGRSETYSTKWLFDGDEFQGSK